MTDRKRAQIAAWWVETVLLFGGSVRLAHSTAALLIEALEGETDD